MFLPAKTLILIQWTGLVAIPYIHIYRLNRWEFVTIIRFLNELVKWKISEKIMFYTSWGVILIRTQLMKNVLSTRLSMLIWVHILVGYQFGMRWNWEWWHGWFFPNSEELLLSITNLWGKNSSRNMDLHISSRRWNSNFFPFLFFIFLFLLR